MQIKRRKVRFWLCDVVRRYGIFVLAFFVTFLGSLILPYRSSEEIAQAVVDPTIPSQTTFVSNNSTASVSIILNDSSSFSTSSGATDASFSISTNNYTGYTLAVRSTKTTLDNGGNSFQSISSPVSEEQFANPSNTALDNHWGYKPNFYNSLENTNYLAAPSTTASVLDSTTVANSTAKNYTISIGARANINTPTGAYVNSAIILEYVANVVPYTITYDGNGEGDTVSNLPTTTSGSAVSATTISLPNNVPTRTNHIFAGWCTVQPTRTLSGESCSGMTYQPEDIYAIDYTNNNTGVVLYAMWYLNYSCNSSATTISQAVCMQDMNDSVVSSMSTGVNYGLFDSRDGAYYMVAKLADGRVWMTKNLDLGRVSLNNDLTSSNSNISSTITAATFNSWITSAGSLTTSDGEFIPIDGADSLNNIPHGTLYNYYAATAGTWSATQDGVNETYDICPAGWRLPTGGSSGEFQTLYSYYNTSELMRSPVNDNGAGFTLSGEFVATTPVSIGSGGSYWSSTAHDDTYANNLYLNGSAVYPATDDKRTFGFSVRCIFKRPRVLTVSYNTGVTDVTVNGISVANGSTITLEEGVSYPISVTLANSYGLSGWSVTSGSVAAPNLEATSITVGSSSSTLTATAMPIVSMQALPGDGCTSTARTVYDERDGQRYTIKRLDDGRCWMIDNLNLGLTDLTVDLTSLNSNLNSTVTASTFNSWRTTGKGTNTYTAGEFVRTSSIDSNSLSKYGTVYNYYAATGGSISGSSNANNASYDICPAGWELPTGKTTGDFGNLLNYYDYESIRRPISSGGAGFALGGYFTNSVSVSRGSYGYYWSSTRSSNTAMYGLYITKTSVSATSTGARTQGRSIRCVQKRTTKTLTVNYGTGITSVEVNGSVIQNGGTITLSSYENATILATLDTGYGFTNWTATSGSISGPTAQATYYTIHFTDATLTASAELVSTQMANLDPSLCTTTDRNVIDSRDGQIYKIKRLDDGNCWMVSNLRLGATALSTDLTSSNTNLSTTISASTFNDWIRTIGTDEASYIYGRIYPVSGYDYTSGIQYGYLYNYYSTSAGTLSGSFNKAKTVSDICPAGWRLPSGGGISEYSTLYSIYSTDTIRQKNFSAGGISLAQNGYSSSGKYLTNVGDGAYYWSSSRDTARDNFGSNGYSNPRNYSYAVRCVLKKSTKTLTVNYGTGISQVYIDDIAVADGGTIALEQGRNYPIKAVTNLSYGFSQWSATSGAIGDYSLEYSSYTIGNSNATITANATLATTAMQNMSTSECTTTPKQVYDNRDNQVYLIQRLRDGNCWMVENLNLGAITLVNDLTSANSNLSSTVSASTFNSWASATETETLTAGKFISLSDYDIENGMDFATIYNYYAASGGTLSSDSYDYNNSIDICPAGWRMSTGGNLKGEVHSLYSLYDEKASALIAPTILGGTNFVRAGLFNSSGLDVNGIKGGIWTSTREDGSKSYISMYGNSFTNNTSELRSSYLGVRCRLKDSPRTLTINYGTGISDITIDGVSVTDGSTISLDPGFGYSIGATPSSGYGFNTWTASSGSLTVAKSQYTIYTINDENATLTASATATTTAMQNLSSSSCTTTASYVYDNRDNQVYMIQKLKDGKCWMVQNLNLGAISLTVDLTSANTNLSNTITAATFNSWKTTSGSSTYDDGKYIFVSDAQYDAGSAYNMVYNYYAASAGTISGSSNSSNASYDICPAGWGLPTGGSSSGELKTLIGSYSLKTEIPAGSNGGLAFNRSGNYSINGITGKGTYGGYWSSTKYSTAEMYDLHYGQTSYTAGWNDRSAGRQIRCVLKS